MITEILPSIRAIFAFTLLTGFLYPLGITGVAHVAFDRKASGSLLQNGETIIGSELLAQKFTDARYFWPRPSAADYSTVASGASNQGYTSKKLLDAVNGRRAAFGSGTPADLLYASGSGLDPHISPEAARFQVSRISKSRGISSGAINDLIGKCTESPQWGFLGQSRVNVLRLNLALNAVK